MKLQLVIFICLHLSTSFAEQQVYIVYLGEHDGERTIDDIHDSHHSYLSLVKKSKDEAKASFIRSYNRVIDGFSALLTPGEAAKLSRIDGVISVFKSESRKMQTTRSWDFIDHLTLSDRGGTISRSKLLAKANHGKDIIVGLIDSGVWPESESFKDDGMGPIPEKWKGTCEPGDSFDASNCNRKLIGARYYLKAFEHVHGALNTRIDYRSARDSAGHGTHTASIVGGKRVGPVSFPGGLAKGFASGGAPHARIAIYKACWQLKYDYSNDFTCHDGDIIAAFDDAIADGVDVISISIVPYNLIPYVHDGISVGAFHAVKKNVVVVACAGNDGPKPGSVNNVAPWILTVGAGSIDRSFRSPVLLGNGTRIQGQSLTTTALRKLSPLIYAGDVEIPFTTNITTTGQCKPGTLSPDLVKGKIVLCLTDSQFITIKAEVVKEAGGVGIIIQSPFEGLIGTPAESFLIPGTTVLYNDAYSIIDYIRRDPLASASIPRAVTILNSLPAPIAAAFSSTGPNGLDPDILKPDIIAPGLSIIAAWSEGAGRTDLTADDRIVKYNVDYGTSMAAPHVAAAAALVKAIHPEWSSAAIRSALMTTARQTNNVGRLITNEFGNPATPFELGAGYFQPTKAIDPGLVYDTSPEDYIRFICHSINHIDNKTLIKIDCPPNYALQPSQLNYPSLAVFEMFHRIDVERTVTNVGSARSVYNVSVHQPEGFKVFISPLTLEFRSTGESQSFTVTITRNKWWWTGGYGFGWYEWNDGTHAVRSPIVVS